MYVKIEENFNFSRNPEKIQNIFEHFPTIFFIYSITSKQGNFTIGRL